MRRFGETRITGSAPGPHWEAVESRILLSASTLSAIGYFGSNASGGNPKAGLVVDAGGNLYGTASNGGAYGGGCVFEIASGSNAITTLASFDGVHGLNPQGRLALDAAGDLYGATAAGGAFADGTVFEVARGSGAITALASFNGTNGQQPEGGVVVDGAGNLYGTTNLGGANHVGTVFEIAAGSGAITTIASFSFTIGEYPIACVTLDAAGNLFGTTNLAGAYNDGIVYEIPAGSNTITAISAFAGSNGAHPAGELTLDASGNLYGVATAGGANNAGAVFKIAAGSRTIVALASLNPPTTGGNSQAALALDASGNLYGTASAGGGASNAGTVFEVANGSGAVTALAAFTGTNGSTPDAGVTLDAAGNLWGTTSVGGANGDGTVFTIAKGSTGLTTVAAFDQLAGGNPHGGLVLDASGNAYGTTGGSTSAPADAEPCGSVFEIAKGSEAITTLAAFNGANGSYPDGDLTIDAAGNLYGTTPSGGAYSAGTVYEIARGSNTITTLASFNGTNGANPQDAVVFDSSGNLYGTTFHGGPDNDGSVFEIANGSNTITTLATFNGNNGQFPRSKVTLDASGNLYGTTEDSGAIGYGTVFEIASGSGAITTLASFNGTNGSYPFAGLTLDASGNLFGTTQRGGTHDDGTVFEIARGSAALTTIASFAGSDGANPAGELALDAAHNLYGTTFQGGPQNDGAVFEIAAGSNAITTLVSFNGANGQSPWGRLALGPLGDLCGTTFAGGPINLGTVYELIAPPALLGAPVINGDDPDGLFNAAGQPTPGVQRSMVEDVVYTFSEPVTIPHANAAFTVQVAGSMGVAPNALFVTAVPGTNGAEWAVSLTGLQEGTLASIANGEYSITINPNAVFAAADGTTTLSSGRTDTFYRLFGDINGDRIVNNADNLRFRRAQATYTPALDFNADGFVNNGDNFELRKDQAIDFFSDGLVITI